MEKLIKSLDFLTKSFLAFLPWSVFISVFLTYGIGIPGISIFKEILLVAIFAVAVAIFAVSKKRPKFDSLDFLIAAYVFWMLLSTAVSGGSFAHYLYGGRYDFEFLFALLAFKHASAFLPGKFSDYLRIFLISASSAIVVGILVRFFFGEETLLYFGFSPELSNWKFWGSVPIYHGIEGANVRRFQGIFDGPNPAAFFLIAYLGTLLHYLRFKRLDAFLISIWIVVVFGLVVYTYSRSALLGIAFWTGTALLFSFRTIWRKYRTALLLSIPLTFLLLGAFYVKFESTMDRIVLREGSSRGHFDRMVIGIERFKQNPVFGEGLASSGPAYRYVTPEVRGEALFEGETKKREDYYVPESWYVQQLVEGGLPGLLLFLGILTALAVRIFPVSLPLFAAFLACSAMNLFLHSFESAYASLSLFAVLGMLVTFVGRNRKSNG